MKKKELKQLHGKTEKELKTLAEKAQEELVKLRLNLGSGKLKDTQVINKKRHDLARLKTILKEKERSK